MVNNELEELLLQRHKDVTLFDFEGKQVPCIVVPGQKFDDVMKVIAGKPVSVETNLNILQDGLGHVFVRITLQFSYGNIEEKFLIYANEAVDFFEALAETALLALSSNSQYGNSNVFMIQLPKPERAQNALEIIRKGLHK
ncbi:hypothetical protein [Candidatus Nitrosotalea okcheonensis]|uniref:Uncharacterized protein n=1 Tax=Candidatus Nitrosotalea okcheonensis TaxID=1903276 RepID=A0A2H1FIJ0_9ARCH|nr:hypothetical protein [Candidatus Nitrosotalea okcheonensis]MDE1728038.1 hypothetical protein [Nitrososphaerota archaeon]MDE1878408.1 hypothetical protein [Nitrososphaerota archaeon]SMH72581.1 conserved protein of unknown function [Candidatus Nitrosotalea okcheonensis]